MVKDTQAAIVHMKGEEGLQEITSDAQPDNIASPRSEGETGTTPTILDKPNPELSIKLPIVGVQPKQVIEQKSGLSSRAREIQANAQIRVQKATALIEQFATEKQAAKSQVNDHQLTIMDIDDRLRDIDELKGLRKVASAFKRKRLEQQKAKLQREINRETIGLSAEEISKTDLISEVPKEEIVLSETVAELVAIKSDYELFLYDVIQDGTITQELQEAYIKNVVVPSVDQAAEWKQLSDDKKETFYAALRNCLQHNDAPEEKRRILREELDRIAYEYEIYTDVIHAYQPLFLYGTNNDIVSKLTARLAAADIATVRTIIDSQLGSGTRYNFDHLLQKAIDPESSNRTNNPDFGGLVMSEVNQGNHNRYPNMRLWEALKSSNAANEIFGDLIKKEDKKIFATALEASLSDSEGWDIDVLDYYPKPEAVRNLVILATADYRNYRTYHANSVLSGFAKRGDWNVILDEAIKVYPALQSARPVLEQWPYNEFGYNPVAQEAMADFALSLIADPTTEARLAGLAMQALPNNSLMELLSQRGVISQAQLTPLKEAEAFLEGIASRQLQAIRDKPGTDIPYISDYLKTVIRSNLFGLMYSGENESEQLEVAKRLNNLSQRILDNQTNYTTLSYLASPEVVDIIAKGQVEPEPILSLPERIPILFYKEMYQAKDFVLAHAGEMIKDASDVAFISRLAEMAGSDTEYLLGHYLDGIEKGVITSENRDRMVETYQIFLQTRTTFSPERMTQYTAAAESPVGKALVDLVEDKIQKCRMIFDYACFTEHQEPNKINLIVQQLRGGADGDELQRMFEILRWLPESNIMPEDNLNTLEEKYRLSQERLKLSFQRIFSNAEQLLNSHQDVDNLNKKLDEICERFKLESRSVTIGGIQVTLPAEFIREFNSLRKQNPQAQFIPELAAHLIGRVSKLSTAYTVEDLMFSQIGETKDLVGRRRGQYTAEQLLQVMENNIEASLFTWMSAIGYQKEQPNSPLFIIANERTGPADLAAEYLPKEFADRFKIFQSADYDKIFDWFRQNERIVESLYDRFRSGENVSDAIPQEILSLLGTKDHSLIPIYRLKIPSSLNAATDEPDGINTVLNFLKLASIVGGRTLFMDESTRSAPRSIECLYNVLNRRQDELGGVRIRLLGKINGVQGQNGTLLQEVSPKTARLEIGFTDPWHSQVKSITDDSAGFVPEVSGIGIVEIVRPSFTSVSPYGIGTVQDFWKQLIANEVSLRYEGFTESGGVKKSREEFKPARSLNDEVYTQTELKDMAFQQTYQALVLDLDGTIGSRGEYNPQIITKIKALAEDGVDVIISTSRSLINNAQYDGSVESLIQQLGQLSGTQKSHIHLATENAVMISTLINLESARGEKLISDDITNSVSSLVSSMSPNIRMFSEQGTLVLRGFADDQKAQTIDKLRQEIERLGLPLKVVSDSPHSIHIRVGNATKRNALNWLESKGINVNDIAKIGDSPSGNDKDMFWGQGAFNVGSDRNGTLWTIHMDEYGGGPTETEKLLEKLQFAKNS